MFADANSATTPSAAASDPSCRRNRQKNIQAATAWASNASSLSALIAVTVSCRVCGRQAPEIGKRGAHIPEFGVRKLTFEDRPRHGQKAEFVGTHTHGQRLRPEGECHYHDQGDRGDLRADPPQLFWEHSHT